MTVPGAALEQALTDSLTPDSDPRPDVIVIGGGGTGGLAAMMLAEAGLHVLVLDAGRRQRRRHIIRDAVLAVSSSAADALLRWPVVGSLLTRGQPVQSRCYAWRRAPDQFVNDSECPYTTPIDQPFIWFRSRQLGGRMEIPGHGRQYYRLSPDDLQAADGLSPRWPIEPSELETWYARVEGMIGLCGTRDGLRCLPDSELANTIVLTPAEVSLKQKIARRWPHSHAVSARFAAPLDALEVAARTGRLRVRSSAVAREITVDSTGGVSGVRWIDADTNREGHARAPIVFIGASALESTRLLLLSKSAQHPHGIGGRSDALGRYLMDHVRVSSYGRGPVFAAAEAPPGRCLYLPRFDGRASPSTPGRGFGVQVYSSSGGTERSHFVATSFGEMLPQSSNRVTLHPTRRDQWGIPILHIECRLGEADLQMAAEQMVALRELADVVGVDLSHVDAAPAPPGSANHECGTARMGVDPAHSVLNPHNECWDVRNLYLADGACLPSQGIANPTLTYLALTARACDRIVRMGVIR